MQHICYFLASHIYFFKIRLDRSALMFYLLKGEVQKKRLEILPVLTIGMPWKLLTRKLK